jgi:hypothetical protein
MITREQIANSNAIWVFGDNLKRTGYGGQAAVCRGLRNTIGIATKMRPDNKQSAFFRDIDFLNIIEIIKYDIDKVEKQILRDKKVYIMRGIGEGRANLQECAPKIFEYLTKKLNHLIDLGAEWIE